MIGLAWKWYTQRVCTRVEQRGTEKRGEKRHVKEGKDWDLSYRGLIDNEDLRRR